MKAVVISIDDNKATVLGRDGIISRIGNNGYSVGEELNIRLLEAGKNAGKISSFSSRFSRKAIRIAAAVMVLAVGIGSVEVYATPCTTVTMDINPSLEYRVNLFDRVVSVVSLNDDAAALLSSVNTNLKNKKIDKVMDITLDALEEADYIKEETSLVVTIDTTLSDKNKTKLENRVNDSITQWNTKKQNEGKKVSVVSETVTVTEEMKDKSRETGSTPGQTILAEKKAAEDAQKAAEEAALAEAVMAMEAAKLQAVVPTPATPAAVASPPASDSGNSCSPDESFEEKEEDEDNHSSSSSKPSPPKKKEKTAVTNETPSEDTSAEADPSLAAEVTLTDSENQAAEEGANPADASASATAALTAVIEVPVALPDGTVVMVPMPVPSEAAPVSSSTDTVIAQPDIAVNADPSAGSSSETVIPATEQPAENSYVPYSEETPEERESREAAEAKEAYEAQEAKEKEASEAKEKEEASSAEN